MKNTRTSSLTYLNIFYTCIEQFYTCSSSVLGRNDLLKKPPPEVLNEKSFSEKFPNIHMKTPELESLFSNLKKKFLKNLKTLKEKLQHRCFLVNITKFLRVPILINICEQLFLLLFIIFYYFFCYYLVSSSFSVYSFSTFLNIESFMDLTHFVKYRNFT